MVSMYCNCLHANKPELVACRVDAIGYQVGHQLSERVMNGFCLLRIQWSGLVY
ncbi:hypothetical protein RchiOBHm_Chr5g0055661 [Rosa chinensis]|uniref:Uncharacterized protein n=1 Tax=Rosa chinensis TaxID=74649 RepID=A0A2P6QGF1_ROSCH|nr:hypothetical protein RchiOBHm_Chr5g0055661 [Rosa chinensis]